MRWDNLKVESARHRTLPGYREPAAVRTFDAPEALDIRFYEVCARSVLNRVPKASRMPFRWTINPYRGCTHACVFCVAGETPILMADGRTKPIREVEVGDRVFGSGLGGSGRRYRPTEVLAHWQTVKPAHRVTLEDGRELVASGDHRFLTDQGWRYVTAAEHGCSPRPHLAIGSQLTGTGRLGVVAIEPLGESTELYDMTTQTGDFVANGVVSHNCFARPTHIFLDLDPGRDFEREIVVKVNAPEVLRAELARPSWKREHVALGTNTDPYQWVEGRYGLMRGIWEALRDSDTPCSVLTKSPLLLRDLDLMQQIHERAGFAANLSVPTLDEQAWRSTEPHTPHPRKRLEAVAELNRAGIPCGVLIAPLMPGINDHPRQVERILELATEAGATQIGGVCLHLRGELRGVFMDWLRSQRPDLVPRYERLYARGGYAPKAERRRLAALARPRGRVGPGARLSATDAPVIERDPAEEGGALVPARRPPSPPRQASLF